MEIEDHLRRFRLASPPTGLKRSVLAAAKPWRPWYLAAAGAVLLACSAVNALSEARLSCVLANSGATAPVDQPAGMLAGRLAASAPPSIGAESLISLKLALEGGRL